MSVQASLTDGPAKGQRLDLPEVLNSITVTLDGVKHSYRLSSCLNGCYGYIYDGPLTNSEVSSQCG